jgi:hypothetical protein
MIRRYESASAPTFPMGSSFHRDVRAGLFPVDWGGAAETTGEFGER